MGVRVTKRHNADGSITKRTTITRKTLFGTTKSETFVERIPAGKNKGCYVATCVYGSYDCPPVWVLRRFRDETLAATIWGRMFIKLYYSVSPSLVKCFGNTAFFQSFVRAMLDRFVMRLKNAGLSDTAYVDEDK